jgi:pimeloyl-ACP methyl ester carboxylesterase
MVSHQHRRTPLDTNQNRVTVKPVMRRPVHLLVGAACLASVAVPLTAVRLDEGRLEGTLYSIAVPDAWNGRLLLLAHGYRPEDQPLHARLYVDKPPVATLLAERWMVAITSYRRNGIIVRDALADLADLRRHIEAKYGTPAHIYLMGESMGGAIATLLAEEDADHLYSGAVAIGAALEIREAGVAPGFTLRPQRPLLFLTNRSEVSGPAAYVRAAASCEVPPVLWRVARDGHVNVNAAEKLAALAALVRWAEAGVRPAADFDATLAPPPALADAAPVTGGALAGRVVEIHPVYGNLTLDLRAGDLDRLGLAQKTWFGLVVGDITLRVYRSSVGNQFDAVKRGQWLAFPDAEDRLVVAINRGNAAAAAKLAVGDGVSLRQLQTGEPAAVER